MMGYLLVNECKDQLLQVLANYCDKEIFFVLIDMPKTKRLTPLHWISWVTAWVGMICLLVSHGHYTVDVLIAYFATTRLFWMYHTFSNNAELQVGKFILLHNFCQLITVPMHNYYRGDRVLIHYLRFGGFHYLSISKEVLKAKFLRNMQFQESKEDEELRVTIEKHFSNSLAYVHLRYFRIILCDII